MRWSCPHCQTNLAIADEKIGPKWAFSRCYKCGAFALVKKPDSNVIKVERAPHDQNILLPEASETPVLSHDATRNLTAILERSNPDISKPTIKRATRRSMGFGTQSKVEVSKKIAIPAALLAKNPLQSDTFGLPEPLPEQPPVRVLQRFLPLAIGTAGAVAIGSGIYFYLEGQSLWLTAQTHGTRAPSEQTMEAQANHPPLTETALIAQAGPEIVSQISDQVERSAMAPTRPKDFPREDSPSQLQIMIKNPQGKLRAGPGSQFAILGTANPQLKYEVISWQDRWFKVSLAQPNALIGNRPAPKFAWIRNDLVELLSPTSP